mmetsp:Transcript_72157/g.167220  ORF Transcript_72157/g.167220 Transcript_72157/m.167220 type:complete len:318 (-) Transcript_72157:97-1050(-)
MNYGTNYGSALTSRGSQDAPQRAAPVPEGQPEHSILRSGGLKGRVRSRVNIWELVLVPWAFLVVILFCYLLGGAHGKPAVLWVIPIVLIGLSVLFIRYHYKHGNNAEVVLGVLCITAVVIGLVVSIYSTLRSLREYHRLSQGASYFNVLPSEAAVGKSDATTLQFTNSTQVDPSRALGFVDARAAITTTYCVAPASNGDEGNRIQYWAAGMNCCERRGNFQCGAAADPLAHGALVLPETTQRMDGFKSAVTAAEAAYGLTSGDNYLLVEWHANPVAYRENLFHSTATLFLIFGTAYLVICAMIGCALMPVVAGTLAK